MQYDWFRQRAEFFDLARESGGYLLQDLGLIFLREKDEMIFKLFFEYFLQTTIK